MEFNVNQGRIARSNGPEKLDGNRVQVEEALLPLTDHANLLFTIFVAAEIPPHRLGWLGERKKCINLALAGQ
jgi:hypothetical protein